MIFARVLIAALLASASALSVEEQSAGTSAAQTSANPIRRVVTMLQAMQKKVTAEGEKEKDLYDKFMCYCKTGSNDLGASIAAAEEKIPQVSSDITAAEEELKALKEELKEAQVDRTAAKKAMAEATGIREKEAAAFEKFSDDSKANIAAIRKAVTAIEKGMKGAFLQTEEAQTLRRLADTMNLVDEDRQELGAFLAGPSWGAGYAPQSGQITGILKTMDDEMAAALHDAIKNEESAQTSYKSLMSAKTKEVAALTDAIESKTKKIGDLGVAIVQMKDDLSDTQAALADDKKFLADLEKGCDTKTAEWDERCKTRAAELVALADTIKILNDDDALELFKKTLPAPSASSLVQLKQTNKALRARALAHLRKAFQKDQGNKPQLDLIALAMAGKKVDFSKVIKMIDDMVALLKKEQNDDNDKKEYCELQFDSSDDKKKALERDLSLAEQAIATAEKGIETTKAEIAALTKGIADLDKSVMDATVQRRAENADFNALISSDTAAKELLLIAKNRLNKFYNPKLYLAPPKKELSAEGRIADSFSFAATGVNSLDSYKAAPPPPPETWGAGGYQKKGEESTGVIGMIDLLIADLDKEMTEAKAEEKDSQNDYEEMMQDSAEKRTADSKSLTDKIGLKADLEAELMKQKGVAKDTKRELYATLKYISQLHAECDWLIQYFSVRKEARTAEIQSLVDAKAVLSGADFSFVQKHSFLAPTH